MSRIPPATSSEGVPKFSTVQLNQLRDVLEGVVLDKVTPEITELRKDISRLDKDISRLDKDISRLDKTVGIIAEQAYRGKVAAQHGVHFAEEQTFQTLHDLARFMLEGASGRVLDQDVHSAAVRLGTAIMEHDVPRRYVREVFAALAAAAGRAGLDADLQSLCDASRNHPCVDAHGNINVPKMRAFLGELSKSTGRHMRLISVLGLIRGVLEQRDMSASVECLLRAGENGSLGVSMAQVAASPPPYVPQLRSYADVRLPASVVQCDMRGCIKVYSDRAVVEVGEFKRSSEMFGEAVTQLVTRLRLFQWVVKTLEPHVASIVLVGHLFLPKDASGKAKSKEVESMRIQVHPL